MLVPIEFDPVISHPDWHEIEDEKMGYTIAGEELSVNNYAGFFFQPVTEKFIEQLQKITQYKYGYILMAIVAGVIIFTYRKKIMSL